MIFVVVAVEGMEWKRKKKLFGCMYASCRERDAEALYGNACRYTWRHSGPFFFFSAVYFHARWMAITMTAATAVAAVLAPPQNTRCRSVVMAVRVRIGGGS